MLPSAEDEPREIPPRLVRIYNSTNAIAQSATSFVHQQIPPFGELLMLGGRRGSHPPAPADPGVRVSRLCRIRHRREYAEPRIMPSRWSLRLVRRLAVVWVFGIIWAAVRIDAVFCRGRVLRWRRRDHEQAVTIAGAGVGAAAGLCGGFPRGVVSAGLFGAVGGRASAVDGAFEPVAGRDRFGPGRIDPAAG